MTREEAIEILKQFKKCLSDVVFDEKGSEAWRMAIQALSQEPCDDAISRESVLNAICDYVALEEYEDKSHTFTIRPLTKRIKQLPSVTQKSGKYTADELREFADGISLSLCSKKSAQHWSYDEETAEQIRWLECLHSKIKTDIADMNCGAYMVEPQESEDKE